VPAHRRPPSWLAGASSPAPQPRRLNAAAGPDDDAGSCE
jgi:hypothetical protein